MKRIAIQGLIGSFHDIAAHLYFEGEQIRNARHREHDCRFIAAQL